MKELNQICFYVKDRIDISLLNEKTYISTENMLQNKEGVTISSNIPKVGKTQAYKKGDILISNIRPYFKKIWYATWDGGCSGDVLVIRAKQGISSRYLYTILSDDRFFTYSMASSKGTKMPRGDKESIMKYSIPDFNPEEQGKISKIVFDINDKIRINNGINDNLYEQMYSIYKSWFELYEKNNGVKPDSWIRASIYEITNVIYGSPFSSKLFNEEKNGRPIIRIRDLKSQNFNTYTPEIHPKGYLLQKGDIVVGMDGEFRPYIWGNEGAWLNQRVCVFDNKRPRGKAFLFFTIKPLLKFIEDTEAATTVIHIGKNDFDKFNFIMPDEKTMNEYDEITFPMYNQISNNLLENTRLIKLRDTLLPKLISGEIDVSNIKLDL